MICANRKKAQNSLHQKAKLRKKQQFAHKINPSVRPELSQKILIVLFMNLHIAIKKISAWLFSIYIRSLQFLSIKKN